MLHLSELRHLKPELRDDPWARFPEPGSSEEHENFAQLQKRLALLWQKVFPDPREPRTVVVIPSLSMDPEVLSRISGVHHYEERMLFMLMLLRLPTTHLIYVTSEPIAPTIIDYYLNLLPGIPTSHARNRLTLLSCFDASGKPLTQKILERPKLLQRIIQAIPDIETAHLTCFNATALERTLAVRLGIPLYACDPDLCWLGSKSGSRKIFRDAGILMPDGFEDLRSRQDLALGIAELKERNPDLRRVVIKLDEGFSGEGNATFWLEDAPKSGLRAWVNEELPRRTRFEAMGETWPHYASKFESMGGIVESWVDGENKRSPSVQCRIDPLGAISVISTHDQILGGDSGQIFLGCAFPADEQYRLEVQDTGVRVSDVLKGYGVRGRFSIDFISVKEGETWRHFAIEINLRKGGTTHPFLMLQFLTDGRYQADTGLYLTPTGRERYYYASDNLVSEDYRGFTPADLIDIAVEHDLHFHGGTQQGVVFHLVGALSEYGKLGVLCIADGPQRARTLYDEAVEVINFEASKQAAYRRSLKLEEFAATYVPSG
ncbi:MAG: peptide ligase PGM1-related protein [Rhodothermales bacterium]|nr:peptide ligase PGM1-related protein [Rhodothermales bacterium]